MNLNNPQNRQKVPEMQARRSPLSTTYRPSFAEVVRGFNNKGASVTRSTVHAPAKEQAVSIPKSKENPVSSADAHAPTTSSRVVMQHGWNPVSIAGAINTTASDDAQVTGTDIWGDPSAVGREKILRWKNGKRNQKQYSKEGFSNLDEISSHSVGETATPDSFLRPYEPRNTSSANAAIVGLSDSIDNLTVSSQKEDFRKNYIQLAEDEARVAATQQFRFAVQAGLLPQSIFNERLPIEILTLIHELFKLQQSLQTCINFSCSQSQLPQSENVFLQNTIQDLKRQLYHTHINIMNAYMHFKNTLEYQPQQSNPTSSGNIYGSVDQINTDINKLNQPARSSMGTTYNPQVPQGFGSSSRPFFYYPSLYSKVSPSVSATNDSRWCSTVITSQSGMNPSFRDNDFVDLNRNFRPINPNVPQPYESMGYGLHDAFDEDQRILNIPTPNASPQAGFGNSGLIDLPSMLQSGTPAHLSNSRFNAFSDYDTSFSNMRGSLYPQANEFSIPVNMNLDSTATPSYNLPFNESPYGNYPSATGNFGGFRDRYNN